MADTHYNHLLDQLQFYRNRLGLNDWGYYLLVRKVASSLQSENGVATDVMTWMLMLRSGYRVKLAYHENLSAVLLPSANTLYSRQYIAIGGVKYYLDGALKGGSLLTYEQDFPGAEQLIDFSLNRTLNFAGEPHSRDISFEWDGIQQEFTFRYSPGIIRFYNDYPLTDLNIYFTAPVGSLLQEDIFVQLQPKLAGMESWEAVSYLLKMVQNGFDYQTDQQQFGREKFFFPDEVFAYPSCDCEDRSVIFSYLVQNLTGLKVIGLQYTDHMSAAVHFNGDAQGDYYAYGGERYTIADPTFQNAPVGMCMPKYRDAQAKIIPLDHSFELAQRSEAVWNEAEKGGTHKGGTFNNIRFTEKDEAYLTGYKSISEGEGVAHYAVVEKRKSSGELVWSYLVKEQGMSTGIALDRGDDGRIYFTGTVNGPKNPGSDIHGEDRKPNLFLGCLDDEGELEWMKTVTLTLPAEKGSLCYRVTASRSGEVADVHLVNEPIDTENQGLWLKDGNVVFAAGTNNLAGMGRQELVLNSGDSFNIPDWLKEENDRLVEADYDQSIAGLFAFMRILADPDSRVEGIDIKTTLDRYNPGFQTRNPDLYQALSGIKLFRNEVGIIIVATASGEPVRLEAMKMKNDSRLKPVYLDNGDCRFEVLSGISVGKGIVWLPLNSVRLGHQTGDLLFDYSHTHAQRMVNLKEDILY